MDFITNVDDSFFDTLLFVKSPEQLLSELEQMLEDGDITVEEAIMMAHDMLGA